jgi:hypothetical protein
MIDIIKDRNSDYVRVPTDFNYKEGKQLAEEFSNISLRGLSKFTSCLNFLRNYSHSLGCRAVQFRCTEDQNATDGTTVYLSTNYFDDLPFKEAFKVFIGVGLHELGHVSFTNFSEMKLLSKLEMFIFNVVEDEALERQLGEVLPMSCVWLSSTKRHFFKVGYDKFIARTDASPLDKFFQDFIFLIRFPSYLSDEYFIEHEDFVKKVEEIILPKGQYLDIIEGETIPASKKLAELFLQYCKEKFTEDFDDALGKQEGDLEEITDEEFQEILSQIAGKLLEKAIEDGFIVDTDESGTDLKDLKKAKELKSLNRAEKLFVNLSDKDVCDRVQLFPALLNKDDETQYRNYLTKNSEVLINAKMIAKEWNSLAKEFDKTFANQHQGKLDSRRIHKFGYAQNIFKKVEEYYTKRLNLCVILDESGSMGCDSRDLTAKKMAITYIEAARLTKWVTVSVYSHTTCNIEGKGVVKCTYYGSSYEPKNLKSLVNFKADAGNEDGRAIEVCVQHATTVFKTKDCNTVVFVLSDGCPIYGSMEEGIRETAKVVQKIEKNFPVFQLALDEGGSERIYKDWVLIKDLQEAYKASIKFLNKPEFKKLLRR